MILVLILGILSILSAHEVIVEVKEERAKIDSQNQRVVAQVDSLKASLVVYYKENNEFPREAYILGGWEQMPQHWTAAFCNAFGFDHVEPMNLVRPGGIAYMANNHAQECTIIGFGDDERVVAWNRLTPWDVRSQ